MTTQNHLFEAPIFQRILKERKSIAEIHSSLSDIPQAVEAHYDFYKKVVLDDDLPLPRHEREFLAVITSQSNTCRYCISHHHQAFKNHAENISEHRSDILKKLAQTLTESPWKAINLKKEALLKGFTSAEFSHAIIIISYFNMANRIAFGMNLELEEDFKLSCH